MKRRRPASSDPDDPMSERRLRLKRAAARALRVGGLTVFFVAVVTGLRRGRAHAEDSSAGPGEARPSCPKEMVHVRSFCVDRWEASTVDRHTSEPLSPYYPPEPALLREVWRSWELDRSVFGNDSARAMPLPELSEWQRTHSFDAEAVSRPNAVPQAYVSYPVAMRACENAGKRLCSLTEWYHACRGDKNTLFPYGPAYVVGRCNVNKPHLLSILHGADPREWKYDEGFNDPELDKRDGFLAETGAYGECVSSAGIYDLVGNLHEWVADRVDASMAHKIPLTAGIRAKLGVNQGKGVFMGGFFSTLNQHGEGCDFITMAHEPGYHDYSTGFRCCKDP